MSKYSLGDLVLVNLYGQNEGKSPSMVFEIDGVTIKRVSGKLCTRYECGDVQFSEDEVVGIVTLKTVKTRKKRLGTVTTLQTEIPLASGATA